MPYNIGKNLGGDNPANVKFVENCVESITGTNKRTGKPYTKGEKIAICKTALEKHKKSKAGITFEKVDEDIFAQVDKAMQVCMNKMMKTGKAKTTEEAKGLCDKMLAKSNYDLRMLELIFNRDL